MKHFYTLVFLFAFLQISVAQLNESFEGTEFPPEGWTLINEGSSNTWEFYDTGNTGKCTRIKYNSSAHNDWLITPQIEVKENDKLTLYAKNHSNSYLEQFHIKLSTSDKQQSDFTATIASAVEPGTVWEQYSYDLSAYAGQKVYIAFQAISEDKYYLYLDDIKVFEPAPMVVSSVTSAQPNTEVVAIGSSNNEILQINVTTSGEIGSLPVSQFSFSTNGSSNVSDISRAALYFCESNSSFNDATLFGETNMPNGEFTITGTQQLSEGDNYFWLVYDVASTAATNNVLDAEFNHITIDATNKTPDNVAPNGNRTLSKILNMPSGTSSFKVNESLAFYDDGGKNEKCTENFEGTVTLMPNTSDKKVKIEWTNFEVFNTSSTGKNDVFKIYHGSIVDENNLIGQYSTTPPTITSMTDDGALTIYFKVNTGLPKAGWEALVTEIVPQNMEFVSVNMSQPTSDVLAAGDQNQIIAQIAVNTQYTKNKLNAESFDLSINGTSDATDIAKAKLYYTATSSVLSTHTLFAEIDHPTGTFMLKGTQALTEGVNYFWLVYDIETTASEGHTVDAEVSAVTISGVSQSLSTPSAIESRVIDNTFYMPISGDHSKKIYSPITFVDDGGTDTNYDVTTMSTVTFIPNLTGEKVKINFDDFEVLYQNTSYGTKTFFAIYNGCSTDEVLWKVDENNHASGPTSIITSSAVDGTLTIKFVGNGYSSTQTKSGWKANVWSELPSDMKYKKAEVTQTTQVIKAGSDNQEILHIQIELSGTLNPLSTLDFSFNTQGTTNVTDISAARLYNTGINASFNTNTQSGDDIVTPNGAFTITHNGALHEGVNHFWLVYDISTNATTDNVLDASLDKISIADKEYAITNGNPDGHRTIKRTYELEAGTHEIILNKNPLTFFDDGGIDANYSKSFEGTVTFAPETAGQRVRLDISSLLITWAEKINIYNGNVVNDDHLVLELDDDDNLTTDQSPIIIKSTSTDGKLTVHFKSNSYSNPLAGWEALAYTFEPQPYTFQNALATQKEEMSALRNESNVNTLCIPVEFSGETTAAVVNAITFNTAGSTNVLDIASAQIFYTAKDAIFNPISAVPYGSLQTAPSGEIMVTGNQEVAIEGTVYFWVMYNVSANAVVDNKLDASLTSITVNNVKHMVSNGNPDDHITIKAGLSGHFTIGSKASDNYASFTAAFADLAEKGIEQPITITVEDGTYNEQPTIPHIKGTSANNTIHFLAQSNQTENVILTCDVTPNTDYTAADDAVLTIAGADYITFSHITFTSSQKLYDALVMVNNQSRHVTFDNCVFNAPVELGSIYSNIDISCVKNNASDVANHNNDYLIIKNSHFIGGEMGAYIGGTGYISLPKEIGAQLINNTFEKQFSKGIYLNNEKDAIITGNTLSNNTSIYSSFNAIDAYRVTGCSTIANNTIQLERSQKSNGIQCRPITGTNEITARIYNNIIVFTQAPGTSYGILLDDKCENAQFYNNTVVIEGEESLGTSAIYIKGSTSEIPNHLEFKNNIFMNNASGSAIKIQQEEFLPQLLFDYNNIFTTGATLASVGYSENLKEMANLPTWKEMVTATHSISENVEFYSTSDAHIKEVGNLNNAISVDYITKDIDGQIRNTTTPTMGADEFSMDTTAPEWNTGFPKTTTVTYQSAILQISVNKGGTAWWIILPQGSEEPTHEQIKAGNDASDFPMENNLKGSIIFNENVIAEKSLESLNSNTSYVIYVAIEDYLTNKSSVISSVSLTTEFQPTEIATFEDVINTGDQSFKDGTALFTNVTVSEGSGVKESAKYGTIDATTLSTVSLTNTSTGINIEGFFYKSDANYKLRGTTADDTYTSFIDVAASDTWLYADLSTLGNITGIEIQASTSAISIDNFADVPMDIQILDFMDKNINRGESVTMEATVTGGVKPYTYFWSSNSKINDNTAVALNVAPESTSEFQLTITDARGNSVSEKAMINVTAENALVATFEDLLSSPETYWMGDPKQNTSFFYSGSFKFNNNYFPNWLTWGAFSYSNETSTIFNPSEYYTQQFRSSVGHGANNSETYGVVYAFGNNPEAVLTNTLQGETLSGCYMTNNAWAVSSMENGDAISGDAFTDGDWFKVSIEGYKDNALTGNIECYLADYRSENTTDHYILKEWKWIDLSSLGVVQKLKFKVDGSKKGTNGLNTPGYFCIDDLNGKRDDTPTQINSNLSDNIKIYPNPTKGIAYVDLSKIENIQELKIYAINGELIKTIETTLKSIQKVDLSDQNSGIYFIRIICDQQIYTYKIRKY